MEKNKGKVEIVECRFDHGAVVGSGKKDGFGTAVGKIKILMVDGSFYDGYWKDHKRDGHGIHYYPNGDRYEGSWSDDCRM